MVARRVGRKLDNSIRKAQFRLEKGRWNTLVDTFFMSGDEKEGFRIGVAERVAKSTGGNTTVATLLRYTLLDQMLAGSTFSS